MWVFFGFFVFWLFFGVFFGFLLWVFLSFNYVNPHSRKKSNRDLHLNGRFFREAAQCSEQLVPVSSPQSNTGHIKEVQTFANAFQDGLYF